MAWIRRSEPPPIPHSCSKPTDDNGYATACHGDLWRCDECGYLWVVDGNFGFVYWMRAGFITRWIYRKKGWKPDVTRNEVILLAQQYDLPLGELDSEEAISLAEKYDLLIEELKR